MNNFNINFQIREYSRVILLTLSFRYHRNERNNFEHFRNTGTMHHFIVSCKTFLKNPGTKL